MINFIKELNHKDIFYFISPWHDNLVYSMIDGNLTVNSDNVAELKKYKLVVANLGTDHWGSHPGVMTRLYNALESAGLNFVLISHCPADHLLRPRLIFYPYYLHKIYSIFANKLCPTLNDVEITSSRKYKLSCLNANARPHRISNYLLMMEKPYFDQCLFSFSNQAVNETETELNETEHTRWENIKSSLPDRDVVFQSSNKNIQKLHIPEMRHRAHLDIDISAFNDSYIHLVTETSVIARILITEKTWKPIAAAQLFLIFGNPGTVAFLREQGVDTFDDIIDHDYYDSTVDWRDRLRQIHTLIDHLMTLDLTQIYQQTWKRRLANRINFCNGNFDKIYHSKFMSFVENALHGTDNEF
jgi:hypothetical protein